MPIYEFECCSCRKIFEKFCGMGQSTTECIKCGNISKRIMSISHFQLKGTGWYKTDYKDKKETGSKDSKT